ncbi:DUF308 domain-containing protein [Corynebacterium bovis]|uniref:DUF308 domain-containing protein n=2 Tax=Corynebacterium bovis TaxID=36808 RepID=UPI000F6305D2|nr:DUF308 domain-containing protein [Corynebacterium bovis]RRO89557.1 hypothetical protein CXF30_02965 [Corynebacterium bovis]
MNEQHRPQQSPQGTAPRGQSPQSTGTPSPDPDRPPRIGRPGGLAPSPSGAPENVRTGVRCWYAVTGLQIIYALLQLVSVLLDPSEQRRQVREQLDSMTIPDGISENTLVAASAIVSTLILLVIAVVCGVLVRRVSRGAVYSRTFLSIGSVYLILNAVLMVFATPPGSTSTVLVLAIGVVVILSGVAAGLGLYFISRPENRPWFGIPEVGGSGSGRPGSRRDDGDRSGGSGRSGGGAAGDGHGTGRGRPDHVVGGRGTPAGHGGRDGRNPAPAPEPTRVWPPASTPDRDPRTPQGQAQPTPQGQPQPDAQWGTPGDGDRDHHRDHDRDHDHDRDRNDAPDRGPRPATGPVRVPPTGRHARPVDEPDGSTGSSPYSGSTGSTGSGPYTGPTGSTGSSPYSGSTGSTPRDGRED